MSEHRDMSEHSGDPHGDLHGDVVIAGAGIAGALIATRLAAAGVRVLMLEAGPREQRADIFLRSTGTGSVDYIAPYPNLPSAPIPRIAPSDDDVIMQAGPDRFQPNYLRLVGGTTWHWGAATMRLAPDDFELKRRYGLATDWPISFSDLQGYYEDAETELGVAGPESPGGKSWLAKRYPLPPQTASYLDRRVREDTAKIGIDWVRRPLARNSLAYDGRPQCQGHANCTPICPIGAQYAAITHIEKAEALGVRLIDNANVQFIETGDGGRVTGLRFRRPDGSMARARGTLFIVAANAIETPRLLLASASERMPDGVANGSGLVGRNLMSHPSAALEISAAEPVFAGRGPQSSIVTVSGLGARRRAERSAFLIAVESRNLPAGAAMNAIDSGLLGQALEDDIRRRAVRRFQLFIHTEDLPEERNRLTLHPSRRDSGHGHRLPDERICKARACRCLRGDGPDRGRDGRRGSVAPDPGRDGPSHGDGAHGHRSAEIRGGCGRAMPPAPQSFSGGLGAFSNRRHFQPDAFNRRIEPAPGLGRPLCTFRVNAIQIISGFILAVHKGR